MCCRVIAHPLLIYVCIYRRFSSDPLSIFNLIGALQVLPFFESLGFKLPDRKVNSCERNLA